MSTPRWIRKTHQERFWDLVDRTSPEGCWPWKGAHISSGYGMWTWRENGQRRAKVAHRVAYEFAVGPIPLGLLLDHTCENKGCCRPSHLEAVTASTNQKRKKYRPKISPLTLFG